MFNAETFKNLDNEFKDSLINFVNESMNDKSKNEISFLFNDIYGELGKQNNLNEEKYSEEITKYMNKDLEFKNDLIKKAKELIETDNDAQGNCQSVYHLIKDTD